MTTAEAPRQILATVTANGTLAAGKHTPVDATGGTRTMALPTTGILTGAYLSVEKRDSSTNTVVVSGSIRGATSTLTIYWQYESITLRYDGATWTPTEGHKTRASLDATYAPKVSPTFTGFFSIGSGGNAGNPLSVNQTINGPAAVASGSTDMVGTQFNTTFTGNFTGMGGADPGFVFGGDHYTTIGDTTGVTNVEGWIGEVSITKSSGTIATVIGTEAGISFAGAASGATVTNGMSLFVADPTRRVMGATAGSIQNAYGLFVAAVTAGTVSNFSLFVSGGVSRFQGRVDVFGNITNGSGGNLDIHGDFSEANAPSITLQAVAGGGHLYGILPTTNSFLMITQNAANGGGLGLVANGAGTVGIGGYPDTGGGSGALLNLKNCTAVPGGTPSGGGVIYVEGGVLKYKGSSGTVTTLGAA